MLLVLRAPTQNWSFLLGVSTEWSNITSHLAAQTRNLGVSLETCSCFSPQPVCHPGLLICTFRGPRPPLPTLQLLLVSSLTVAANSQFLPWAHPLYPEVPFTLALIVILHPWSQRPGALLSFSGPCAEPQGPRLSQLLCLLRVMVAVLLSSGPLSQPSLTLP